MNESENRNAVDFSGVRPAPPARESMAGADRAQTSLGVAHVHRHAASCRQQLHLQGGADAVVGRYREDTIVTWTLTPTPSGGTRLGLEHSGFSPANAFAFDGATKGWQRMVGERLREVLARVA